MHPAMNYRSIGSDGRDARPAAAAAVPATPLARQSSVYSLTFGEFQSTMAPPGKDFGSLNMDELLKSIWSAEESQTVAPAAGAPDDGGGGLQWQGSLTLPRTLSQKTVDEVWRDLVVEEGSGCHGFQQQRQPALREMTLEEFLLRAGVGREDFNQSAAGPMVNNSSYGGVDYGELPASSNNAGFALEFLQASRNNGAAVVPNPIPISARPYAAPVPLGNAADLASPQGLRGAGIVGIGDPVAMSNGLMPGVVGLGGAGVTVAAVGSSVNQISPDGLTKANMDLSSLSPVPYMFSEGLRGKKRSGTVEKVVERRQKRMIKNRESAARSRARKQAYTMELEAEVAKLKEQNEELQKKQEEVTEIQKIQVLEMIDEQHGPKKRCLRRTHTGPW